MCNCNISQWRSALSSHRWGAADRLGPCLLSDVGFSFHSKCSFGFLLTRCCCVTICVTCWGKLVTVSFMCSHVYTETCCNDSWKSVCKSKWNGRTAEKPWAFPWCSQTLVGLPCVGEQSFFGLNSRCVTLEFVSTPSQSQQRPPSLSLVLAEVCFH